MESPTTETPLKLIIRFAFSFPDLPLAISSASTTTATHLNQLIRPHLPADLSSSRIRLIHSGAVLSAAAPLSASLRIPTPLPPPPPSSKGKAPVYLSQPQILYIHCSLGDPLDPTELAEEARLASTFPFSDPSDKHVTATATSSSQSSSSTTTTAAPVGFDRLLSAGLSPAEIASLRSQFLAIQAHIHTPDTMPSATEMRVLEEHWMDNTSRTGATTNPLEGGGAVDDEEGGAGGLDDILWGNVMGFFWPVGAVVWGFREEGVWSKRRQIAVLTGVLVNLAFSVLRVAV